MTDEFGRYLALGATIVIVVQGFINMSVVTSLLPTKGIPLPFISSGGSSLLISLLAVGVLLMGGAQISSHSGKSFPTLLAGGGKLGFKHGRHVKFESEKKPMSNLYLTILQQLGCPVAAFKESNGTLSELLA